MATTFWFSLLFGKLSVMLGFWLLFIVLVSSISPAAAVGKKRNREALDQAELNDDFPAGDDDGLFDLPDEQKTLNVWTKFPLEVLKLKCSNLMLPCRGSSFDLASRLYYFYHPSLALQSNQRPVINFTSSSSPSLINNIIVTDTPVISSNSINSQTGFVASTAVPICTTSSSSSPRLRLNRRCSKRPISANSSVSGCSNTVISSNTCSSITSQALPSNVNSGISSVGGEDMRNVLCSEIRSALSSHDFVSSLSQSVSLHLAANTGNNNPVNNNPVEQPSINVNQPIEHEAPVPGFGDVGYGEFMVQSGSSLPPISPSAVRRIQSGEYVEFDSLLYSGALSGTSTDYSVNVGNSGGSPSISLIPRLGSKKITDFQSWWFAWSTFMRVFLQFYPHKMKQLLFYQSSISQFGTQFSFADVYSYDKLFRQRMALEPHLRWDRFDHELVFRCLRNSRTFTSNSSNVSCYKCKRSGHYASQCAFPRSDASFASSSSARTPSWPRFRQPSPSHRSSCSAFNNNGFCINNRCLNDHSCQKCGGKHPAFFCSHS